jgi:hypothetical protein
LHIPASNTYQSLQTYSQKGEDHAGALHAATRVLSVSAGRFSSSCSQSKAFVGAFQTQSKQIAEESVNVCRGLVTIYPQLDHVSIATGHDELVIPKVTHPHSISIRPHHVTVRLDSSVLTHSQLLVILQERSN